jgi:hypothetical protein
MAPQTKHAPTKKKNRRQPPTGTQHMPPIVQSRQVSGVRRSARLQAKDARKPPVFHDILSQPGPATGSTKRVYTKGKQTAKQTRTRSPVFKLTEANLRTFNGEDLPSSSALRQPLSAMSTDVGTVRTKYSSTNALYRYKHLAAAQVYIHTDPPIDIQDAIKDIIEIEGTKERQEELRAISQNFYNNCKKRVKAARHEDDFIDLLRDALKAMNYSSLCLCEKAEWRNEIRPKVHSLALNLSFIQQEDNELSTPSTKRKKPNTSLNSSQLSETNPSTSTRSCYRPLNPSLNKVKESSPIKSPRPDISIGIQDTSFFSALSSQKLSKTRASLFLEKLESVIN